MAIEGYVDRCTETLVAGWVWDSADPARHVDVDIIVDGEVAARVCAGQYRDDLRKNNIGNGNHAFFYSFPSPVDISRHAISVQALDGKTLPLSATAHSGLAPLISPMDWPAIRVDTEATSEQLDQLYARVGVVWSQLGLSEPYWSVLTAPEFKTSVFSAADHLSAFYDTGAIKIEEFAACIARSGLCLSSRDVCFELGCGVGRLTAWLAPKFKQVIAADISKQHLDIASEALRARNIGNVCFCHLASVRQLEKVGGFDIFFSLIVLQHNPPPVIMSMLKMIFAQLNPGGIGYFQLPTYEKGYTFDVKAYLAETSNCMEMHILPQHSVIDTIYHSGCRLLEIREDDLTGSHTGISNTFLIQKL